MHRHHFSSLDHVDVLWKIRQWSCKWFKWIVEKLHFFFVIRLKCRFFAFTLDNCELYFRFLFLGWIRRQIQDPASQRLTWYKPPLAVLVIKKIRDQLVLPPFVQLVEWLIQVKTFNYSIAFCWKAKKLIKKSSSTSNLTILSFQSHRRSIWLFGWKRLY